MSRPSSSFAETARPSCRSCRNDAPPSIFLNLQSRKKRETFSTRNHLTPQWANQSAARRKSAESTTKSPMADAPNSTSETGPHDLNTSNRDQHNTPNRLQRKKQHKNNNRSNIKIKTRSSLSTLWTAFLPSATAT